MKSTLLEKIIVGIFALFVFIIITCFYALFSGTILYFIWPVVMVDVFHFPALTWFQAVCLTWICGILIKSHNSNKS